MKCTGNLELLLRSSWLPTNQCYSKLDNLKEREVLWSYNPSPSSSPPHSPPPLSHIISVQKSGISLVFSFSGRAGGGVFPVSFARGS